MVFHKYGLPDVLQLEDVEKPIPGDDEVLVKVHMSSVNDWDWQLLRGVPFVNRIMSGLMKPKKIKILGLDIAGTVESIGKDVTKFQVGDAVFGDISGNRFGGFAEFTCVREDGLTLKPASMSFEQAAAIPHVAVLGLQGLFFKGEVKSGEKILMNGAGGGLGTIVVQVAKSLGAEVTAVDNGMKLDMLLSLGADHVIDYTKEDFTRNGVGYDRIIDVAGFRPIFAYKRALASRGIYGMIGGATSRIMQTLALAPIIGLLGSKKMGVVRHKANKDMEHVIELLEDGKLMPVIDRTYPLDEVPDALRFFGEAKSQGKILIKI